MGAVFLVKEDPIREIAMVVAEIPTIGIQKMEVFPKISKLLALALLCCCCCCSNCELDRKIVLSVAGNVL